MVKSLVFVLLGISFCISSFTLTASADETESDALSKKIGSIIEHLPDSEESQKNSIAELKQIGPQSIPYLIKHLNDFRKVPSKYMFAIYLTNMPDDPINVRTVNDILVLFLQAFTSVYFENYKYDFEVTDNKNLGINKWRKWCADRYPDKRDICLNSRNGIPEKVVPLEFNN